MPHEARANGVAADSDACGAAGRAPPSSEAGVAGNEAENTAPPSGAPVLDRPDAARWIVAWVGASVLGITNGAIRELAYKDRVGDSTANQISVATLIALLALYFWVLQRRWPLATTRGALSIGAIWVVLSVLFEFGFAHYVGGDSWEKLLENYDLTEGNLWMFVLLSIAAGPETVRAIAAERSA